MKTIYQAEGDVFTAIAHPVRRQILDILTVEEKPVTQLASHFLVTRPAISQHLKVLLEAGLVTERRRGRERIYRLEAEPLKELDEWLESYRHLWEARLDRLDDYLKQLQTRKDQWHGLEEWDEDDGDAA